MEQAASEQLLFELVTPEKLAYSAPVAMVEIPGTLGDFGVLPGHAPFMSMIRPGVIRIHVGEAIEELFVEGGYAEVNGKSCTVLAEQQTPLSAFTAEQARDALEKAKLDAERAQNEAEKAKAERALEIAEALVHATSSRA